MFWSWNLIWGVPEHDSSVGGVRCLMGGGEEGVRCLERGQVFLLFLTITPNVLRITHYEHLKTKEGQW